MHEWFPFIHFSETLNYDLRGSLSLFCPTLALMACSSVPFFFFFLSLMVLLFSGFVCSEWMISFIHFGETLNQNPRRARSLSRVPHHLQWSIRLFLLLSLTLSSSFLALLVACKPCHCCWHVAVVFLMEGKHDVLTTSRSSSGGGSSCCCCFCCRSLGQNSWLWWDRDLVASSVFLQFATVVGDPWFAAAAVASAAAMGSGSVFYSSSVVFIGGEQSFSRVLIGLLLVLLLRPFTVCFPSLFPLFFLPLQWMNAWMHGWRWPYLCRYLYWCKSARRRWWWCS